MNIPESTELLRIWQTWLGSCRNACDEDGKKLWDRIDAALAAAPTPPAQEKADRLCPECKHCDWSSTPAQEDEPVGELVKFGDGPWGEIYKSYVNIPAGTKLYTRPQSDEPVGFISDYGLRLIKEREDIGATALILHKQSGAHNIPLYTRPQSDRYTILPTEKYDELREMVEDVVSTLETWCDEHHGRLALKLRSALERK